MTSRDPIARATACAAVGPRWRIPRPTSTRASPRVFERLDPRDEVLGRLLRHALEREQPLDGERVDVARVGEQARVDELADALLAEPLDVHRVAPGEVHDSLHALLGTLDVDAVVVRLALEAHERRAARRAVLRERATCARPSCASPGPDRRPRGSRRPPCGRRPCRPAARPCARPRPRCATSRARRSSHRRTPARAGRTVWPARSDRCSRRSRAGASSSPRAGTCTRSTSGAPCSSCPSPRVGRGRRP